MLKKEHPLKDISALILAAGKGSRMNSPLPKVLIPLVGKPLIEHTLEAVKEAGITEVCLVLSKDTAPFLSLLQKRPLLSACIQETPNGTAGAVASTAPFYQKTPIPYASHRFFCGPKSSSVYVLIVNGDTPLLDPQILYEFCTQTSEKGLKLAVLGTKVPDPAGYGRLIEKESGMLAKIREDKDASPEEKNIHLINTGVILAHVDTLFYLLAKVEPKNAQNEYYLTDIIGQADQEGIPVGVHKAFAWERFLGVNTQEQLSQLEKIISENR